MIFKSNLNKLKYGANMFHYLGGIEGYGEAEMPYMEFISDLPNLIDGTRMFKEVILSKFQADEKGKKVNLDNLEIGKYMFGGSWYVGGPTIYGRHGKEVVQMLSQIDLPKLKDGSGMFALLDFHDYEYTGALPELEIGGDMFGGDPGNLTYLKSFQSELPKLKVGDWMFCGRGMTKFRSSLPSLISGKDMFAGVWILPNKLDSLSIKCIVESLPDRTGLTNYNGEYIDGSERYDGMIDIEIGCENTDEDKQLYAEEGGFLSFQDMIDKFTAKNWIVNLLCQGRPTDSSTYSLRKTSVESPIWCKLEEIILPSDEELKKGVGKHYQFTSQDKTKLYNIHSYHVSNGNNEGYTQFNSLEEAIEYFNIKPIERN